MLKRTQCSRVSSLLFSIFNNFFIIFILYSAMRNDAVGMPLINSFIIITVVFMGYSHKLDIKKNESI